MIDVIRKCLEELNSESPNIDYVRGMLDTLLAMSEGPALAQKTLDNDSKHLMDKGFKVNLPPLNEAQVLDAKARASLETLKALAPE